MKKISLLFLLLPMLATASFAQESRQDASVSGTLVFPPYVNGQGVFSLDAWPPPLLPLRPMPHPQAVAPAMALACWRVTATW